MKFDHSTVITESESAKPETISDEKLMAYLHEIGVTDISIWWEQGCIVLSAKDGPRMYKWVTGGTGLNGCLLELLRQVRNGRFKSSFELLETADWHKYTPTDNILRTRWTKFVSTLAKVHLYVDISLVRLTYFTADVYTDEHRRDKILSVGGNDSGAVDSVFALFDRIREAEKELEEPYRGILV